ncbi:MFS transporter [Lactococcus nasutitermitis]|uniref:MFS transporter n=1 Tax=Lactococcus nasutitermitis TaxID=1652957 RepID=A0ABV9JF45_9LACT|nr:MFS transporter [Lactococcus nasutitermitis]
MTFKKVTIVIALFLGVFVVGADSFIISPLLPEIAHDFHTSISQTALGVTTYALCEMIGAPLFGPLGDRFSKRRLLLVGLSIFLLGTFLCAIATSLVPFYIYRAIAGLGAALFLPNVWAFIGSYFENKTMNKIMGLVMSALSLSVALGVPLGSFLAQLSSWHSAFWASGILSAIVVLIVFIAIPNTRSQSQKVTYLANFKAVFKTKNAPQALLTDLFWMFAFYILYTFLGSFLTLNFQFNVATTGTIFLIYGFANFIAASTGGFIMNHLGREKSIFINGCASIVFVLCLGLLGKSFPLMLLFLICIAFSMGFGVTAISAYLASLSANHRSTLMSFNSSALYLGLTIASALGGFIFENVGFWLLGVLSALAFAVATFLAHQLTKK